MAASCSTSAESDDYPWYDEVDSSQGLKQGDIFTPCPIVIPLNISLLRPSIRAVGIRAARRSHRAPKTIPFSISEYDVVVMSQSCDLEEKKLKIVLVCPFFPISDFEKLGGTFASTAWKESVRRGNEPGYHMLKESDPHQSEMALSIVDLRSVFGIPYDSLTDLARARDKRLRLLPPYREHLSQAFARFFMRVGLPTDIPKFKSKKTKG